VGLKKRRFLRTERRDGSHLKIIWA